MEGGRIFGRGVRKNGGSDEPPEPPPPGYGPGYLPASNARGNRTQAAQPTNLVYELTRRRWFIVKKCWRVKCRPYLAPCVTKRHLYHKSGEVVVTAVTSTQPRRLSG